ncbi:MAG: DUF402 domain-containing protein [Anaerolineales bacterium]|nr:DUF402 domain-containing protein [Anaerolineales bacterium]MCB9126693.1 DUF402 domain-containing protein [Ardenticatenales bacterium]MCB9171765.1 DUF402 domain-containing protein [Ardenticatenales bacterium]
MSIAATTPISIHSTKHDGSLHWLYDCYLIDRGDWGWLTYTPAGQTVLTHKGTWLNLHSFFRWHWRDRWWDALLVFQDNGSWLEWYCNIITPPVLRNDTLQFTDLDLDVVWHYLRGIQIVDAEEFESNAVTMNYPSDLIQTVWQTAQEVRRWMKAGRWRFAQRPTSLTLRDELVAWPQLPPHLAL